MIKTDTENVVVKKHASLFRNSTGIEIVQPELNLRIGKLYVIIQLYIEKDEINLYNILSMDLSSCLKKKYYKYIYFILLMIKSVSEDLAHTF